jgi:hypothetical protein
MGFGEWGPETGYPVDFALEQGHFPSPGYLRLMLLSCDRLTHLVGAGVELRDGGFRTCVAEHFQLRGLKRLRATLGAYEAGEIDRSVELTTEGGWFDLQVRWDAERGHAVFTGHIPPERPTSGYLQLHHDPLSLRRWIKRAVAFEFWMTPALLEEPRVTLGMFLERYRSLGTEPRL